MMKQFWIHRPAFFVRLVVFSQPQTKDAIDNIFETIALLTTPMYRNNDNEFYNRSKLTMEFAKQLKKVTNR